MTAAVGLLSSPLSRTDTERAAMVLLRGTGRGGPQSLPALDVFGDLLSSMADGADHGRGSGRLECMSGRQHARTGGSRRHRPTLGHPASRQIHPCAERRRKLLPRPRFGSDDLARWAGPPLVCRYLSTVCGLLAWLAGGSRKRPFAKRSARSLWGERNRKTTACPVAEVNTGR